MGVIYACVQAMEEFVGTDTHAWNSKANVFLWLLFYVEMLVMRPKREKLGGQEETINKCVARRLHLFCCGHIQLLWEESRRIRSRKPGMARPLTQEKNDKLVQDAEDKHNYRTAYARAVKPSLIDTITGWYHHIVGSKYPP